MNIGPNLMDQIYLAFGIKCQRLSAGGAGGLKFIYVF